MRASPDDRGSILLWWTIAFFAVIVFLGLVVDGGGKLHADQQAQLTAEEAARGAGQAIITPLAKHGIATVVDPFKAAAEAQRYLNTNGIVGVAVPTGPTSVLITTTTSYQPKILGILGLGPQPVIGTATVQLNHTNTLLPGMP